MQNLQEVINSILNNKKISHGFSEYRGQIKKILIVSGLIVLGIVVYSAGIGDRNSDNSAEETHVDNTEVTATSIFVDIGGAVNTPMLAELPEGSRVEDAIQAAGGLKEDADLSSINRAEFLEDGVKIYIPVYETDKDGNVIESAENDGSSSTGLSSDGKVNINTADSDTLQTLTGVGPVTAQKIIDYREDTGRFSSIEDLKNVSGIGDKTFEKLKEYITI